MKHIRTNTNRVPRLTPKERDDIRLAARAAGITSQRHTNHFLEFAQNVSPATALALIASVQEYNEDETHPAHEWVREALS